MNEQSLNSIFDGSEIPGLGRIAIVKFDAPEGYFDSYDTYQCECIIKVDNGLSIAYYRRTGEATSYGGVTWYSWRVVQPKEKIVLVYEDVDNG